MLRADIRRNILAEIENDRRMSDKQRALVLGIALEQEVSRARRRARRKLFVANRPD
jgi:hypothetical protein